MRKILPLLIISLFSITCFADGGGKASPTAPDKGDMDTFTKWCEKNGASTTACEDNEQHHPHVCNSDTQTGCKDSFTMDQAIAVPVSEADAKSKIDTQLKSLKSLTAACCSGDKDNCKGSSDAAADVPTLDDDAKKADSLKANVDVAAKATKDRVKSAKAMSETCQAAAFNCMFMAHKYQGDAKSAANCTDCSSIASSADSVSQSCGSTVANSKTSDVHKQAEEDNKKVEDTSKKIASDTPTSTNPTKSTPSGGGGSGGSGDMTSMMKGLAQAAQAYMQAEMAQQQQQATPAAAAAATTCTAASVGGACPAAAATSTPSWNAGKATVGLSQTAAPSATSNPGDLNDQMAGAGPAPLPYTQLQPASAQAIAPGGGGSGMMGGSGGGATLGGAMAANMANRGTGVDTQIMHGEGGGGYSATVASMNMGTNNGGGYSQSYGRDPASDRNFDLKNFLPGGRNDPTRTLAGGNVPSPQIQSSQVNIWSRISDHIKARCSQGLLRDCVP